MPTEILAAFSFLQINRRGKYSTMLNKKSNDLSMAVFLLPRQLCAKKLHASCAGIAASHLVIFTHAISCLYS